MYKRRVFSPRSAKELFQEAQEMGEEAEDAGEDDTEAKMDEAPTSTPAAAASEAEPPKPTQEIAADELGADAPEIMVDVDADDMD
mmetsp:Transcript_40081/g.125485  ORF Transcript_40081/g.125485 Transcript_40081/m.125485 type:complete len:85 (+) Transcript_40081:1539-1793(+)